MNAPDITRAPTTAGLTTAEAAARLRRDGPNTLPTPARPHPALLFAGQLTHFFALMLWAAAGLALLAGMPALAVAIAVVVLLNGAFAFAQEYRADRAAEKLRDLLPLRARVRRDGRVAVVEAAELVVGDRIVLEAGDRVCADADVLTAGRLQVDESMLTGESRPIAAAAGTRLHAGTYVVAGGCEAVIAAIGSATRLAGLANITQRASRPRSPLTRQLHRVVRVVALLAVLVGVVSFAAFAALGRDTTDSLLFAIGVTVALVPEGLLPTVTLSLARAAQRMAGAHALVRRLESVETLGATTFICTDKTGTLTRNEMQVVRVWTPRGEVSVHGDGYDPAGALIGSPEAVDAAAALADSAARCSPDAHAVQRGDRWLPVGDPMEVAVHVLAARAGCAPAPPAADRDPFDPHLRRALVNDADGLHVTGAPEAVFALCDSPLDTAAVRDPGSGLDAAALSAARARVAEFTSSGLRVIAVARKLASGNDTHLLGLVGLEDPPRSDVAEAIAACRRAGIRLAMVTGDHPGTAEAVAVEVGLLGAQRIVLEGRDLPADDGELGALLDSDGVVVARVAPEEKLRIARVLQQRGHIVAMTGDGVNDGPALRTADIGIAMGASGTDVAREAADLVLLDDHFGTIVSAVELGRATFANIRRFLTYHLTDNVAELTPFAAWAASGGSIPLGFTVLQVLALDIGTDMLPALALGAEPPNPRTMSGPARVEALVDRRLLRRVFFALGPAEAGAGMLAFLMVLYAGGWRWGLPADPALVALASGALFTAVVLGQLTNAFACRSESRPARFGGWRDNPLLPMAIAVELIMLGVFLFLPPLPDLLGGSAPNALGWALAAVAIPAVLVADLVHKFSARRSQAAPLGIRRTETMSRSDSPRIPLPPGTAVRALIGCLLRTIALLLRREVRLPTANLGVRLRFADGTSATVFRETRIDRAAPRHPCVLVVTFTLRGVRGRGHALFRRESVLNTLLFAGFPGLVTKLWLAHDERGRYRGLYEWDGAARAEAYARALWRVLALVSVPGSIDYHVIPGPRREELLTPGLSHAPPDRTGDWWRVAGADAPLVRDRSAVPN